MANLRSLTNLDSQYCQATHMIAHSGPRFLDMSPEYLSGKHLACCLHRKTERDKFATGLHPLCLPKAKPPALSCYDEIEVIQEMFSKQILVDQKEPRAWNCGFRGFVVGQQGLSKHQHLQR
jgi:hypothetical protein